MRVRTNARMAALRPPAADVPPGADELAPTLLAVVALGFAEVGDCVVLAAYESSARDALPARPDASDVEAFANHVHVADLLPPGTEAPEVLAQAVYYVRRLAADLRAAYPERSFELVVTCGHACTARFRTVRPGRPPADVDAAAEPMLAVTVP